MSRFWTWSNPRPPSLTLQPQHRITSSPQPSKLAAPPHHLHATNQRIESILTPLRLLQHPARQPRIRRIRLLLRAQIRQPSRSITLLHRTRQQPRIHLHQQRPRPVLPQRADSKGQTRNPASRSFISHGIARRLPVPTLPLPPIWNGLFGVIPNIFAARSASPPSSRTAILFS